VNPNKDKIFIKRNYDKNFIKHNYDKIFNKSLFFYKLTNDLIKTNICPNFALMYAYDKNKSEILTEPIEGTIANFLQRGHF
jgi:hypothetical protein